VIFYIDNFHLFAYNIDAPRNSKAGENQRRKVMDLKPQRGGQSVRAARLPMKGKPGASRWRKVNGSLPKVQGIMGIRQGEDSQTASVKAKPVKTGGAKSWA